VNVLRIVVAAAVLLLGIFVALSPAVVYAPTPRVVLYLLIACLPAVLLAAEATAKFQMRLPGFVATAGGAAALLLIVLVLLTYLSKPEEKIAVYQIVDQQRQPIMGLDRTGAVKVPPTVSGLSVTKYVDGNVITLIFPEQVGECELQIQPVSTGPVYSAVVHYAGSRQAKLIVGKDFR
jgi:hypothetical protein